MRYIVQRYSRYAIYEPAEGGYYYDGLEPDDGPGELIIRDTKAEAVEALRKLVDNDNALMEEEYLDHGGSGDANDRIEGYLHISNDGAHAVSVNHRYIGDGEEYYVEPMNRRGRHRKGRVPYQ
jgi:hypothetical protein